MLLITLLGLLLRISYIFKPEGMWNDEYVSWMISNTPFMQGFVKSILNQCHMPLYYLYLKPFSYYSDTILRLSSVLPGVLSIPVMFLVGSQYSKKTGLYAALITSVLSFLIYYSQEIRFYSLIFFLTALLLLFTIRIIKNYNKTNLIAFIMFSLLIVFTHVLGFIYVLFNLIYVLYKRRYFIHFFKTNKILKILFIILGFILFLFFGVNILKQLPSSQWWGHFSYTNILFLFSDFFSPVLTNHVNAPAKFFYDKSLIIWQTIPTIIAFAAMICGIKQYKGLAITVLLTVISISALASSGFIVFITKYLVEVLPILILIISCGFERCKTPGLVLLIIFMLFHLAAFETPIYVTKLYRAEGHRIPGTILNIRNPQKVVFTYYSPERFNRYINLKDIEMYSIDKNNRKEYFKAPENILKNINKGETFSVVFLNSVSFVPEQYIVNPNNTKIPEMFITFSHIKNMLIKNIHSNCKVLHIDTIGSWTVITAIK